MGELNKGTALDIKFYDSISVDSGEEEVEVGDSNNYENAVGVVNKYQQWSVLSKGVYQAIGNPVTRKQIPAGYYNLDVDRNGNIFVSEKSYISDDYIELPIAEFDEIKKDISTFWDKKDKFEKYGFVHKRGILIHGKQGLGKSFLINGIMKDLIENKNGIVFSIFNSRDLELFHSFFINQFRKVEPNRPTVIIIEDIDGLTSNKSTETELLNLLDGVEHSDGVVYLATTNHIDKLEERITNRPSRFDRRYHIKSPNDEVRKIFIENKLNYEDKQTIDVDDLVKKTEGFNLAHIKELIISIVIYDNTIDYAIEHLNNMRSRPSTDREYTDGASGTGFGFTNSKAYN